MNPIITNAITREREYQDMVHGTTKQHPHTILEWIRIMAKELQEAENEWMEGRLQSSLTEILQTVATGVACLEQHGVVERDHQYWILMRK